MASGGYRVGAGRPRKPDHELSRPRSKKSETAAASNTPSPNNAVDLTPLVFAFKVMNDPTQSPDRRDRFCVALLPYFHSKMGELGKKDHAKNTAKLASESGRFKANVVPIKTKR